ncbi:MAG: secretin N-terminal domain-containing protein [Planctomycetota bacterium]
MQRRPSTHPLRRRGQGALLTVLLGTLAAGCGLLDRRAPGRLDSPIGGKIPFATTVVRDTPTLDELDPDLLRELRAQLESTPDDVPVPSPALRLGGTGRSDFQFRGAQLGDVIASLADLAGANIVFDPSLTQPVFASFPSIRVGEALHAILDEHDLELIESPPGVFVVRDTALGGGRSRTFKLKSLKATDAVDEIQAAAGTEATVVADTAQNMIFVRGSRDAIAAVESYLAGADQLERQVLIEVNILEAILDEEFELGLTHMIDGTIDGNAFSIAQNLATPGGGAFNATLDLANGDISSTITALETIADLELISSPRVLTVSGAEAKVEVVEEIPYIEATTTTDTNGGLATTAIEQVAFKEAGIKLTVTPTIQTDGILKVTINQELSDVVGEFRTIPILDVRTIGSDFLVANEQTIVLGGLMQDRRMDTETGVPLFKDIPLVGRLFRSDLDATEKRELLIFVTPRVVDPVQAAALARIFQNHYERQRADMKLRPRVR